MNWISAVTLSAGLLGAAAPVEAQLGRAPTGRDTFALRDVALSEALDSVAQYLSTGRPLAWVPEPAPDPSVNAWWRGYVEKGALRGLCGGIDLRCDRHATWFVSVRHPEFRGDTATIEAHYSHLQERAPSMSEPALVLRQWELGIYSRRIDPWEATVDGDDSGLGTFWKLVAVRRDGGWVIIKRSRIMYII
jgi:hypothetical protein